MKSLAEIRQLDVRQRAGDLAAAAFFLMKAGERGEGLAADLAERAGWPRTAAVLKAAATGGTTGGWGNLLTDAGAASAAFLTTLRQASAFDRMYEDMLRLPPGAGARVQTQVIAGGAPAEGAAMPVYGFAFSSTPMRRFKSGAIVVISNSVLDLAPTDAISIIETELRRGTAAATDRDVLSALALGVTPAASAGASAANVLADIEGALDSMELGATSRVYLIAPAAQVRHLATKTDTAGRRAFPDVGINGGRIGDITIVPTDQSPVAGSPAAPLTLVADASRVVAWNEAVAITRATHAAIEMADNPAQDATTPTGAQMVSLWQVNASGVMASRWWSAARAADSAVAAIAASW